MTSSLSSLVNNLSEGIQRIEFKFGHGDKESQTRGIKYKYWDLFLKYINFKDDLIKYKCLCCHKNDQHMYDEKLKEQFLNAYQFYNHDNNKFMLLLWKGIYPYGYMNDWKKFNEK